jgi:large repetitive protein
MTLCAAVLPSGHHGTRLAAAGGSVEVTRVRAAVSAHAAVPLFGLDPILLTDTTPPDPPVITTPTNGALLAQTNVTVGGTAEPFSTVTVTYSSGGSASGTADGAGAFAIGRSVVNGTHVVKATARDAAGNVSGESAPISFTTDTIPPARPQITAPTNGGHVNTTTVTISGSAEPASTVQVFEGAQIAVTTTGGNGAWTTSASFAPGAHSIVARATDAAGNTSMTSLTTTFTVDITAPPVPVITSPAEGAVINPAQAVIEGVAEPAAQILLYRGLTVVAVTTAAYDGSWSQRLAVESGQIGVRAQARDNAGNASSLSAERTFIVDATPPSVRFSTADGSIITQLDTARIRGTAEDNHAVKSITLDFYDVAGRGSSSQTICTGCPGASVTWEAASTPLVGRYVIRAYATDVVGNRSPEATITVIFVRATP